MSIQDINPATGETFTTYDEMTPAEVVPIIERIHDAFLDWRTTSFAVRARGMKSAAQDGRSFLL